MLAWTPSVYQRLVVERKLQGGRADVTLDEPPSQHAHYTQAPRVLVVSSVFPDPTLEAGSKALLHFVELLREAEANVTFWSDLSPRSAREPAFLEALHVDMFERTVDGDFSKWFPAKDALEPFDAVVLDRPMTTAIHAPVVRRTSHARRVYYGQDIHHRRMQAGRQLAPVSAFDIACMTRIERRLWLSEDVVLYPSSEEVAIVNSCRAAHQLQPNAAVMPLWSAPAISKENPSPSRRNDMLFVGSAIHAPNIDGLNWFFREILPRIRASGINDAVHVVGAGMKNYHPPIADAAIFIHGWMSEPDLAALYAHTRVALAPLRYGGGVKGKVLDAMMQGVPCVLTSPAAEGLPVAVANHWPKDDPAEFASSVVTLMRNDTLWREQSQAGLTYLQHTYGRARLVHHVADLVLTQASASRQPPPV